MHKLIKYSILYLFLCSINVNLFAQYFISGFIYDIESNEPLIGATIFDTTSKVGVISNEFGQYRLRTSLNSVLKISYYGYKSKILDFIESESINVFLEPSIDLEEIIINANNESIELKRPGIINFQIENLKTIPSVGGEKDILKAIVILPGVSNGSEGTSSLIVRGGGQDQNLYVLDGAPVYNTGHLLNFISVFNPDALKKVDFYKGGMPARFGGRLSSVMDVTFREGNKKKQAGIFDVGLINSKLALEGPLSKNGKSSYLLAARSTYLDFIQSLIGNSARKVKTFRKEKFTGYTFYDLNLKLNHEWNQNQKMYFSYFEGKDRLRTIENAFELDDTKISVTNRSLSWKYLHVLSNKASVNILVNYTLNKGNNSHTKESENFGLSGSEHTDLESKNTRFNKLEDFSFYFQGDYAISNSNYLRFGLQNTYHVYSPNSSRQFIKELFSVNDSLKFLSDIKYLSPILRVPELAFFLEDDISISSKISLNIGIRNSYFFSKEKTNSGLEPRIALKYILPKIFTVTVTYAKNFQYSHALQSNEIGFERLIWVPSGKKLTPQTSNTFSIGLLKSFNKLGLDLTVEGYSKKMKGLSQFIYYYDFGDNIYQNWDKNILSNGIGNSKGFELSLSKITGKLTGLFSYTLSKTDRLFNGFNNNEKFSFKYDRRHIANLFITRELLKNWKLGLLFNYSTGFRFTPPTGKIKDVPFLSSGRFSNNEQYLYEKVNSGKMPDYHRLDLNASHEKIRDDGKIRTWSINIYNAYNRLNPLFIYIKRGSTFGNPQVVTSTTIKAINILPIIPSVNYSLKF